MEVDLPVLYKVIACVWKKDKVNWEELLASVTGSSIRWFSRWKKGVTGVLCLCEEFLNVPLMGTRGCINYNPVLAIRQLGEANTEILQKIHKAWNKVERKDKELRGISNGVIGGYHKWLKSRVQGIAWLKKLEGLNGKEIEVSEESEEVQVLKAELEKTKVAKEKLKEMKKARREELSRKRFQGALLGSSNELKLRKAERDKSMMENIMLKDELRNCRESKDILKGQLSKTKKNMLIIIDQYKEKTEKEAREEVIKLLHEEGMKWMDRHVKARIMSDIEQVQEQMKDDMKAMKEQMTTMIEAMMSMRKMMEVNVVTTVVASTATEMDPIHRPISIK
ncbi:hypothetical protein GmHk_04G009998 [Glycine max]|nr:hypothetical protein GmHk_04G009998 [Glycine max]